MKAEKLSIVVSENAGSVSAELIADDDMRFLYVFGHGAGAGMSHPFMVRLSDELASLNIGTLRYNFPYMEKGRKRPDVPAVAEKSVLRAIDLAQERYPRVDILAGGKSFGGRMTSQALSKEKQPPVKGLVFVGFPLHPAGRPGTDRAKHLANINVPMLFLQGTRDSLAELSLIELVCKGLHRATLEKFQGADHSFKAGRADLIPLLARSIHDWSATL
jgi:uncharacterized protein